MESKTNLYLGIIIGLLAGLLIYSYIDNRYTRNAIDVGTLSHMDNDYVAYPMMSEMMHGGHDDSMEQMTLELTSLSGVEFDKAFLEAMIIHHQGAIDMANLVSARTDNQDLKKMGEDIIKIQTDEIKLMEAWLKELPSN